MEIVGPNVKPFAVTVPVMQDLEGNLLEEPKTPQMQFKMQMPAPVPVYSIVRHAVDLSAK
jgi:putative protease